MLPRLAVLLTFALGFLPVSASAQAVVDDNPAVTSPEPGKLVVAARAADGTIVVRDLDTGSGAWSEWRAVRGAKATSGPALTHDDDGRLRLFARGEDGGLIANAGRLDAWTGWSQLKGQLLSGPGAANRQGSARIDVMFVGPNGVRHTGQESPTSPFGGSIRVGTGEGPNKTAVPGTAAPGVVSRMSQHISGFVRQGDGSVTEVFRNPGDPGWSQKALGAQAVSAVTALSRDPGGMGIYYRGMDGSIYTRWYTGQQWLGDEGLAIRAASGTSAPAAAATGNGRMDMVTRDATTLYHSSFREDGTWGPLVAVGPIVAPADRGAVNGVGGGDGARLAVSLAGARQVRGKRGKRKRGRASRGGVYRLGQRVVLRGRLVGVNGEPVASASVALAARNLAAGARERPLATVRTGPDGRFSYTYEAGPGRRLTARYKAFVNDAGPAARAVVEARTKARVSLRVSQRGRTVHFRGRLGGGAIPKGGKSLFIQAYQRGRWRGIASDVRTDRKGRYRMRYRFDTPVASNTRVRFRAVVRGEAAYPFVGSVSKVRTLK